MLLGLFLRQFSPPRPRETGPRIRGSQLRPDLVQPTLSAIAQRISDQGENLLTDSEKLIWNTAVVIAFTTDDNRIGVPTDAKISSWGAARAGFRAMGLPEMAEFVRMLVIELAYRADLNIRDEAADSASLLRIADFKHSIRMIEAEFDFHYELNELIAGLHERYSPPNHAAITTTVPSKPTGAR